jgi:hypothetical protein
MRCDVLALTEREDEFAFEDDYDSITKTLAGRTRKRLPENPELNCLFLAPPNRSPIVLELELVLG